MTAKQNYPEADQFWKDPPGSASPFKDGDPNPTNQGARMGPTTSSRCQRSLTEDYSPLFPARSFLRLKGRLRQCHHRSGNGRRSIRPPRLGMAT
jgi:hypothetical protein